MVILCRKAKQYTRPQRSLCHQYTFRSSNKPRNSSRTVKREIKQNCKGSQQYHTRMKHIENSIRLSTGLQQNELYSVFTLNDTKIIPASTTQQDTGSSIIRVAYAMNIIKYMMYAHIQNVLYINHNIQDDINCFLHCM